MTTDRSHLADTADMLGPGVRLALAGLDLEDCDRGAVLLAIRYADEIDGAGAVGPDGEPLSDPAITLAALGPKLLAALESLGATPAGRSKAKQTGAAVNGALASFRRNAG